VSGASPPPLWRDRDFRKLWLGETISLLGSQVTTLALPLTAALVLHAGAAQLGALRVLQTLPFLLLGLGAGVLIDRARRRPILIAADLGRAVLLGTIPLAWALGLLDLRQLFVIAPLVGTLRLAYNVAYNAYLPTLLPRERIVEGNSRLGLSAAVAETAGPGLAGMLVALVAPPLAIAADAASFLVSALAIAAIRAPEPRPANQGKRRLWPELREGILTLGRQPILRATAAYSALMNLCFQAVHTIFVLFATAELGLSPALFGAILTASSLGGLLGAALVPPLVARVGPGPAMLVAAGYYAIGALAIPLATGGRWQATVVLLVAWGAIGVGNGIGNIVSASLTQLLVPARLLGRVNATQATLGWGAAPLGALLGGIAGQGLGLRPTLTLAALGVLGTALWLAASPLRALREQPPTIG
jgi:MFS family permease